MNYTVKKFSNCKKWVTFENAGHTEYNGSRRGKIGRTVKKKKKEKRVRFGKKGHTKKLAILGKTVYTVKTGKLCHTVKNESHLENWSTFEKRVTFTKLGRIVKYVIHLKNETL